MNMATFPINGTGFDPTIAPSRAWTRFALQETPEFPAQIRVHNTLKNGLLMSYWTCIAISEVGIYDVDVRDLPTVTPEQAQDHSAAIFIGPAAQRDAALALIAQAFPTQSAMLVWLESQDQQEGSAIKLHSWKAASAAREGGAT